MARATLGTINPSTTSGTALAALLSARDAAENTEHSGTGRPSYAAEGMLYAESSTSPPHIFLAGSAGDGSLDVDLTLLFSPRPGTLRSSAEVRLPSGWLWADGSAVLRATYPDLLNATAPAFTGTTTNASATITVVSEDLRTLGLIGSKIEGSGIPAGATITAVTSTTITISANATASAAGVALRAFPQGNGNGSTTFNVFNAKNKTLIGRGDMGGTDAGLITVAGGAGFDGTRLGATGGAQAFQLLVTHLPIHAHSASTSGTTDTAAAHTHTDTFAVAAGGAHTHTYVRFGIGTFSGASFLTSAKSDGIIDFYQNASNVTSGVSATHSHSLTGSVQSGGAHSHVLTLSTTIGNTGGDTAHPNVQPSAVCNVLVKT